MNSENFRKPIITPEKETSEFRDPLQSCTFNRSSTRTIISSRARMSTLPFDVICEIIKHLDIDFTTDVSTLKALSTTCHAVLEPSQRKLFSRISINLKPLIAARPNTAYIALYNLFLNTSPHLAAYPRHLQIIYQVPHPDTTIVIALLNIVSSVASIQTLHLWNMQLKTSYKEESSSWAYTVLKIFSPRHSLFQLRLSGHGILPPSLFDLPSLAALSTIDVGQWTIGDKLIPIKARFLHLKSLAIEALPGINSGERVGVFLRVLPQLTKLEMRFPGNVYSLSTSIPQCK